MFFDMLEYIYSEIVLYILYNEIKYNVKKISFGQNKPYKKCPFFSFESSKLSQFYF